jgi:N-acyl-phosphatidylethanolamine-hydrolysing phospholipase D
LNRRRTGAAGVWVAIGFVALLAGCSSFGTFAAISWRNVGVFLRSPTPAPVETLSPRRDDARLAVTWVGHATALIQIEDRFILTDPVFTEFVGGVQRRLVAPGLQVVDLPPIDVALISHMHFDHLSVGSLEMAAGKLASVVAPLRANRYVPDLGYQRFELSPWGSIDLKGLRITAVPVLHDGRRYGFDREMTDACAGYVVEYAGVTVYFGGDQAYSAEFSAQVAARFSRIDLALLPIGPIEPDEFMRKTHLDPAQALRTAMDIGALNMVPIHHSTFLMSPTDAPGAELALLAGALEQHPSFAPRVRVLRIGQVATVVSR